MTISSCLVLPFSRPRPWHGAALLLLSLALAGCGGGDDGTTAAAAGTTGGSSGSGGGSAAAVLVISGATPAALNGTLDKAAAAFESNSSSDTLGTFASTDAYCRVAAYALRNSGDGVRYFIELSFAKSNRAVGLMKFGLDSNLSTLARVAGPQTAVAIDTVNRRIVFSNLTLASTGTTITLNGSLEYPSNVAPENRAACG